MLNSNEWDCCPKDQINLIISNDHLLKFKLKGVRGNFYTIK